jgi:hypothetical protein
MPVIYDIDKTQGIIVTRCVGDVKLGQVIGHFESLIQDPDCPPKLDVLLDLTECLSIPENYELQPVSDKIGSVRKKVKFEACAIVVSSDLMYGMARMFLVFADERFQVAQVFRSANDAKKWLIGQKNQS